MCCLIKKHNQTWCEIYSMHLINALGHPLYDNSTHVCLIQDICTHIMNYWHKCCNHSNIASTPVSSHRVPMWQTHSMSSFGVDGCRLQAQLQSHITCYCCFQQRKATSNTKTKTTHIQQTTSKSYRFKNTMKTQSSQTQ